MASEYVRPDKSLEPTYASKMPDAFEECERLLKRWRKVGKPWPHMMPLEGKDAAHWWITEIQEPWDEQHEKPSRTSLMGTKDGQRWLTPYVDRVRAALGIFLRLPADRQRFVVAAREDGYWWRGEHEDVWKDGRKVWLFMLVIEQYEAQKRLGKEAYRQKAVAAMKEGLRKMAGHEVTGRRRPST